MLVVIPFDNKYAPAAVRMLQWCAELSGRIRHPCLLVACRDTDPEILMNVRAEATFAFSEVNVIKPSENDNHTWPETPNLLFRTTCAYVEKVVRQPFFWMEVDCVPLVADWLDPIEAEYFEMKKPYMGFRRDIPVPHISAPAVYPSNVSKFNPQSLRHNRNQYGGIPFDTVDGFLTLKHAHVTRLIHHEWGERDKPPTFQDQKSLCGINSEAVIFHRCKDFSLQQRLSEILNNEA